VHVCSAALTLRGGTLIVGTMAELDTQTATPLTLTPRAVEQIRVVRRREGFPDGHVLRVSVVGGGCSGFSYQLDFDEAPGAEDLVSEYDGVRVAVDPVSAQYLQGTQIDFVSSLHGGGFKFVNPKATHTCGCGSSFSA
jgi:iron-sulfur cluster assembly accessory protein